MLEKYNSGSQLLSDVIENYRNTFWLRHAFSYVLARPLHQTIHPNSRATIQVTDEKWDNLLVLDACRADLFEEVATMSMFDNYRTVFSAGSATPEWTQNNFSSKTFGDIVYVSGNPFTSKLASDAFHDLIEVWKDSFSKKHGTVTPESIVEAVRDARERYPKKRVIAHFMQPHYPFLGSQHLQYKGLDIEGILGENGATDAQNPIHPWEALEQGLIEHSKVWEAYADNLEVVLSKAVPLARELDGLSVITSDHGNMLGERAWPLPLRLYGHPEGLRSRSVIEVPWAEIDGSRRDIEDGTTLQQENVEDDVIHERLRSLGYQT